MEYLTKKYAFFRLLFLACCDFLITFSSVIVSIFIYTRVARIGHTWPIISLIIFTIFIIKFASFSFFRIYAISFQHASILYAVKTSATILISSFISYFILKLILPQYWLFIIAALYVLLDMAGSVCFRFLPLIYHEVYNRLGPEDRNCLIYGAGHTGMSLIPILGRNNIKIRGFIDDDIHKLHKIISGIKVQGKFADLERILTKAKIDTLIIAIPSLNGARIKEIRAACAGLNIELKTIPSFYQIYNRNMEDIATSIRDISYEDLIRRPVRKENFSGLEDFFRSKKVLVTGSGSIGSELISQLVNFDLQEAVVLDNCEINLFNLENSLDKNAIKKVRLKLADLKNKKLLEKIFSDYKPDFVFHTAAYKHVPIVENNLYEGLLNNLLCVKNIYEASSEYGAKKFIFISSDKAVRPTNIMGVTKRMGELYVQAMGISGRMQSCSVRFGNVMGSSGSLIPKIINQIQQNKAVTITHPQAHRFFMLISEAVLLILKAAIITKGGEIFILDMGEPIKIVDMVRDIAGFYGKTLEVDIPIEYIGLRPGEKLVEELIFDGVEEKVYKDDMYIAKPNEFGYKEFINDYNKIVSLLGDTNGDTMLKLIKKYVKIYSNEELSAQSTI